jgi:MSHA pilin protein MshD
MSNRPAPGFTLVEMIIAMVIISLGLAGVLSVLSRTGVQSADPMVSKQLTAIAEGMMEEVMLKPVKGPGTACTRTDFDEIRDYDGYAQPVCDVTGTPGVNGYTVQVKVAAAAGAALAGALPAADVMRIEVTVSRGAASYALVGWRYSY